MEPLPRIKALQKALAQPTRQLTEHRVYQQISSKEDLQTFMQFHCFAVWDFMSLGKALQRHLTCIELPWKPSANPRVARFINEIILEEETDLRPDGSPASHYELYLEAMREAGAPTETLENFVAGAPALEAMPAYIEDSVLDDPLKAFLKGTFQVIAEGQPHRIAAAFTFGREGLIPDMFRQIVKQLQNQHPEAFGALIYYLERHIGLDEDEHGPLALQLVAALCGESERRWREAEAMAQKALQLRLELWEAIAQRLQGRYAPFADK